MRGAANRGLAWSTLKRACSSASLKAASILALLAMKGARSLTTVRRSEKLDTATMADIRGVLGRGLKSHCSAKRYPYNYHWLRL